MIRRIIDAFRGIEKPTPALDTPAAAPTPRITHLPRGTAYPEWLVETVPTRPNAGGRLVAECDALIVELPESVLVVPAALDTFGSFTIAAIKPGTTVRATERSVHFVCGLMTFPRPATAPAQIEGWPYP